MLVLARRECERIIIGDKDVVIQVVKIDGEKVRLGITARPNVTIHREEVFDEIKRGGRAR